MTTHLSQEFAWPENFIFGSATAAAQIEGAGHLYGKEDSVWDAFARKAGAIAGGENLEVAVDHYHRYREDVQLMRELGLDSYRFSTSWARVIPGGRTVNNEGLDFYSRLVDELLENGILPWLTLYHWDLPQALEEEGGWTNRDTAYRFVEYAEAVYNKLGDRVHHWTTFNEPLCSSLIGYAAGEHAPGRQEPESALAAVHHQHLAHGLAVQKLRELGAQEIGITLNLTNAVPNDPNDPVDLEAARRIDALFNRMYLDPILRGSYPQDLLEDVQHLGLTQRIQPGDMDQIHQPIDFIGVNHYHDDNVSGHPLPAGEPAAMQPTAAAKSSPFVGSEYVTFPARDLPHTAMGWEVNPEGLRVLLNRLTRDYPNLPPLYITENGASYTDEVTEEGTVEDTERSEYILNHLDQVAKALEDGVDLRGYFVWSLLDNFEWAWGYDKRFGIIHVNYQTQERIIKNSGKAYASLIAANRTMT